MYICTTNNYFGMVLLSLAILLVNMCIIILGIKNCMLIVKWLPIYSEISLGFERVSKTVLRWFISFDKYNIRRTNFVLSYVVIWETNSWFLFKNLRERTPTVTARNLLKWTNIKNWRPTPICNIALSAHPICLLNRLFVESTCIMQATDITSYVPQARCLKEIVWELGTPFCW